jgi:hypothetical protein
MEKQQTKNIITKESIAKELRFLSSADIRTAIILGVVSSVFCIPLTIGSVLAIFKEFNNIIIEIILCILIGGICILPVAVTAFIIVKRLTEKRLIDKGEFEISARELLYKEEKYERRGRHHRTVKVLHFSGFEVATLGGTVYQLAAADDKFYLVHYRGKSSVMLFYPAKMYEYREN